MKGSLRRPLDPHRKHLAKDYRDPVPRELPSVPRYEFQEKADLVSVTNVRSNDEIWDRLRDLKLLRRNRYTSVADLKNRQRAIILSLPHLGNKKLRRLKLPADEYIPLELEEDNYHLASAFLRYLIKRHDEILSTEDWGRTGQEPLRQQPQKIELLARLLKQLNSYMAKGDLRSFITLCLNSAIFFEKEIKSCWWLAQEFYKMGSEVSSLIKNDFGYSQALIDYMYGKFLLFKFDNRSEAIECLFRAFNMSKGKMWDVEWLTGVQDERIAESSRVLCYIAYLAEAESLCYDNPELAMKHSQKAINIAYKGTEKNEAMFDYATYALRANKLTEALHVLELMSEKCVKGKHLDVYLSIQFLLVECFMRKEDPEQALKKLTSIAELAMKIKVPWLRALAFRYIGQIYLQKEEKKDAFKYFSCAAKINKLDNILDELAKCEYLIGCCQINENNDT